MELVHARSRQVLFSFSFFHFGPIQSEMIRNSPNLVRFYPNKKRTKKDLLPKDLWEKKGEGEEERSATKWFMRKEEKKKKKKMMMMMWRCGGWSSTAGYYHRNSLLWNFKKGKVWWQMIVDFQIKPWNVILIKQFIMAKYFDNCINWNNYLSLKNNIILQNLLPKY